MAEPMGEDLTNDEEDFATLLAGSRDSIGRAKRLSAGEVVRGRVVALGADTAFVAVGGKSEAVIHLAEFRDPVTGELRLAVGDEIEATVTDDGGTSGTIVLKHTLGRGGHVPGELEQALAHGIAVEGLVTGQNKGGLDVQIAGCRAFCPASHVDLRRVELEQYVGQRLRFRIRKIDAGGRNIVVSRREILEEEAAARAARTWARLHDGAVVQGVVTSVRDFGAFVDLGGVEGLVHVSELGYRRVDHPSEVLETGQTVEVKVLRIDPAGDGGRAKVSLSLRALAPDPWAGAAERFAVGTTLRGKVRRLERFGAFIELAPGIEGLVHVSRMSPDRAVSHPRQVVAVGDEVGVSVIRVEAENRRIGLSMVETGQREREAVEEEALAPTASLSDHGAFGTLGDLLARSRERKHRG
jgi:small subunit ribosomal protein S1